MANLTVTDTQLNKMTQSIRGAINEKYGSMREAFKAIDTDRSGKLSRREIMRAVASFQLNIPREHLLQLMQARAASAKTEKEIDDQVQKITQTAYDACYKMLTENRALLDGLTDRLIEDETIDYEQLATMRDEHFASMPAPAAA